MFILCHSYVVKKKVTTKIILKKILFEKIEKIKMGNKIIEVKTARLGKNKTFQHELGEHPWKSDFIALIDITPALIYLSIIPNFTEEHYQHPKRKATPYFNKSITLRKETSDANSGAFKLTLTENDLRTKNTLIITNETEDIINTFINSIIN